MRIAIIGAGIAGVTTAYECATDGHQVTVFERRGSVAAEGSFANAGIAAPGLSLPWSPARFPGIGGYAKLAWGWQRWRAGRSKSQADLQARMLTLALFSHARLAELRRRLQLDYERAEGILVLLHKERELQAAQADLARLTQSGISNQLLSADECRQFEPGLNPEKSFFGGLHLSQAESGNCRQFAHLLRVEAQRLGVQFRFHTTVRHLAPGAPARLTHEYTPPQENLVDTSRASETLASQESRDTRPMEPGRVEDSFDAVIICAGAGASSLLRTLRLKAPLTTVCGASITAPLRQLEAHPDLGPRAAVLDHHEQVSISRIGQRVRVAGCLEPGGADGRPKTSALAHLHKSLNDWFPGAMHSNPVQYWQGSQALAADGLPLLGACGRDGIWLNLAQGSASSLGWPLACGAARALADQVAGRKPRADAADATGLDMGRFA